MKKSFLEILAICCSVALLTGWTVFWVVQVIDVMEFLELANG
ncbi:MAG: hypothetical protein ACR2QM_10860 [Longimicrobiales bacterium]